MGKCIITRRGGDTSDATATAADIRAGKTAYVNGKKITGTGIVATGIASSQLTEINMSSMVNGYISASLSGYAIHIRLDDRNHNEYVLATVYLK